MEREEILASLEKLLADLSVDVRYEKGEFVGGFYRYKGKEQLIINKGLTVEQKVNIIASELKTNWGLDDLYVDPALREVIENASRLA